MAKGKVWKGILAGGAAGLAGTIAMTQFQILWGKASEKLTKNRKGISSGDRPARRAKTQP